MDESDGVFAKRRRNLLIAGVVIIIISIANPNLEQLTLFDIEFNFKNRQWLIWLGLFLWFSYTVIRVYTYYYTYIHQDYLKTKRKFIYSTYEGQKYFFSVLENNRRSLEMSHNQPRYRNARVTVENMEPIMNEYLENGIIPGKALFYFTLENIQGVGTKKSVEQLIEFPVNREINKHFKKRKRQFILNDNWWEYVFLIIFSSVVLISLIISWSRLI